MLRATGKLKEETMLVLSRKLGETIVVDGSIRITVVAVNGERVRLGIAAPPDVRIDREEVHARRDWSDRHWCAQR